MGDFREISESFEGDFREFKGRFQGVLSNFRWRRNALKRGDWKDISEKVVCRIYLRHTYSSKVIVIMEARSLYLLEILQVLNRLASPMCFVTSIIMF